MKTSYTDTGYCCACDLLPGWTVSGSKDFNKFKSYVQESIDFYINCAKKDGDQYPAVFDGEYEITLYTSCCNCDKGIYYYKTYDNSQITAVDMHRENLDSQKIIRYPAITEGKICWQN